MGQGSAFHSALQSRCSRQRTYFLITSMDIDAKGLHTACTCTHGDLILGRQLKFSLVIQAFSKNLIHWEERWFILKVHFGWAWFYVEFSFHYFMVQRLIEFSFTFTSFTLNFWWICIVSVWIKTVIASFVAQLHISYFNPGDLNFKGKLSLGEKQSTGIEQQNPTVDCIHML